MREIFVVVLFVLVVEVLGANVGRNDTNVAVIDEMSDLERDFIKNVTAFSTESEGRKKKNKNKVKKPQIPPITSDPVQAVQTRIPCECKGGICSCCIGGFFFNNKGCMKIKYIPEDFAFELRMTFNENVLYKNTMSGKNPRPICISPPRFNQWIEMCARFHDIYFVGRNMHLCLDISATLGDFDLVDRLVNIFGNRRSLNIHFYIYHFVESLIV